MVAPVTREDDKGSEAPEYQPLVVVLAGFAAGIAADRACPLPGGSRADSSERNYRLELLSQPATT